LSLNWFVLKKAALEKNSFATDVKLNSFETWVRVGVSKSVWEWGRVRKRERGREKFRRNRTAVYESSAPLSSLWTSSMSLQWMPICPFISLPNHFLVHRFSMNNLQREEETVSVCWCKRKIVCVCVCVLV